MTELGDDTDGQISESTTRGVLRERALARIGRDATSSLDLEAILHAVLLAIGETLPLRGGTIALLDDRDELSIVAAFGTLDDAARAVRIRRGEGIAGWVVEHGEPFLSPDLDREERLALPTRSTGTNRLIRSYLAAPLIADDRPIGVLQIDSELPDAFDEADRDFLVAVASQVAGAVRNARLYAQVQAEQDRLRAVVEALPDAVLVVSGDGVVMQMNPAAVALWGRAIPPGMRLAPDTFPPIEPDGTPIPLEHRPLYRAMQGESVKDDETILLRPDGTRLVVCGSAVPLRGPDGAVNAVVAVYQDITRRKDVERLRDEFLATASHDLRNPLTTVKGLVQLLRRQLTRPEAADPAAIGRGLATVEQEVNRLAQMMDTLLDVSRIQLGVLEVRPAPFDLAALLATLTEHRRIVASSHQFSLCLAQARVLVEAEESRIGEVIENLLSNAVKYSPDGGMITITLTVESEHAHVAVRDEGIGVKPDALDHLFDRFYRTESVRAGGVTGAGLGLYICRAIIEAHGGTIGAESAGEGQGTTVWFRLPSAVPAAGNDE